MPLRIAARKVPDAVLLPVDADAYNEASERVMETLRGLGVVEVLGWDEAFLGVETEDPEAFARWIQAAVLQATDLHCSVGIGDNKIRAKIATGFGKPRGVYRLTRENWLEVMGDRPTIELWGVGSKVSKRLAGLGIETVRQLAAAPEGALVGEFGPRMGVWYGQLGKGIGSAIVDDTPWIARGHSRETTYQANLVTRDQVLEAVRELAGQAFDDTVAEGRPVTRVTLKVRYAPFFTQSKAMKLREPTNDRETVVAAALALVDKLDPDREIRLLGVRAEMQMPAEGDPVERTPVRGRL
jgi:DNA polymerase-4